jgi:GMP synthase (glutamine-hydrolysing)
MRSAVFLIWYTDTQHTMHRIIVFQSRATPSSLEAEQRAMIRSVDGHATCAFLSTLDTSLPWDDPSAIVGAYDGVIFGGSGDYDFDGGRPEDDHARLTSREVLKRTTPLIEYLISTSIPTLGICYGHQLIAEARDGKITHDKEQHKIGTHDVSLTDEGLADPLFSSLPQHFTAQYGHKDSVTSAPRGGTLLARGPRCSWSAIRYGSAVYTTQFHPELTAHDVIERLSASPGYLPEGGVSDDFVRPSHDASRIIPLFIERIVAPI